MPRTGRSAAPTPARPDGRRHRRTVRAAPIAWTDLRLLPGSEGIVRYLAAVIGLPGHVELPGTVLLIARIGVLVLVPSLAPLVSLLRRLPQQEAAGQLYQAGLRD